MKSLSLWKYAILLLSQKTRLIFKSWFGNIWANIGLWHGTSPPQKKSKRLHPKPAPSMVWWELQTAGPNARPTTFPKAWWLGRSGNRHAWMVRQSSVALATQSTDHVCELYFEEASLLPTSQQAPFPSPKMRISPKKATWNPRDLRVLEQNHPTKEWGNACSIL